MQRIRRGNSVFGFFEGTAREEKRVSTVIFLGRWKAIEDRSGITGALRPINAAKKGKGKSSFETQMLLLNAVECADFRCYSLLDTGANALVVPKTAGVKGAEAQCTVPGGKVVSGMVVQVVACDGEEYHAVAIEGGDSIITAVMVASSGWMEIPPESGKGARSGCWCSRRKARKLS